MKHCFFITPIGKEKTPIRVKSDRMLELLQKVLRDYGFELQRSDTHESVGNITHQVIQAILESELTIVDLSEQNVNVFYELGIRHSTGKPVISIIEKGKTIPFDISQQRTIQYSIDSLEEREEFIITFRNVLVNTIKFPFDVHNPVSILENFIPLRSEAIPPEKKLFQIINKLTRVSGLLEPIDPHYGNIFGKHSANVMHNIVPLMMRDIDRQLERLIQGVVETWGDLNNEVFGILMEGVTDHFRAISVNDLTYWLSPEGSQYLKYLFKKMDSLNIKAERVFIINDFNDLLRKPEGNNNQNIFELILLYQVKMGIHVRLAYAKDVRITVYSGIVKDLDFGLFDEFAVSFFRVTQGRKHKVDFTKEEYNRHNELFERVKLKCQINPNSEDLDKRVFLNQDDIIAWFNNQLKIRKSSEFDLEGK